MPGKALLYWHTLRWLKPVQIYGRLWFRLYHPRIDSRPAPDFGTASGLWVGCARKASYSPPDSFRFVGVVRRLAAPADWDRPDWPKLWRYNAHYFDDLVASDAAQRRDAHAALVARWIRENPPGQGTGWEPYPVSLRVVNWVKWMLSGNVPSGDAVHSLAVQARWLRRRLEIHLQGNHLWANLKALLFAGAFFPGSEAELWRTSALERFREELKEQILADGGHFERSPMYHAIVLEDLLDLLHLARVFPGKFVDADVSGWSSTAIRMLRWLRVMSHPDGGIALFNDAALDIAPKYSALSEYAARLGLAPDNSPLADIESLEDSGFVRLCVGTAVLIADVGVIGPDYLPGHGHADTLSFELSLSGHRVIVNGGTSTYEPGSERLRQRGTAAHSTVMVDGVDSSEVWGSFRVARRARPLDVHFGRDGDLLWIKAAHDGYRRLPGDVIHHRHWKLGANDLTVTDTLKGRWRSAMARFHFAPGARVDFVSEGASVREVESCWHPRFGEALPNRVLEAVPSGNQWASHFSWR